MAVRCDGVIGIGPPTGGLNEKSEPTATPAPRPTPEPIPLPDAQMNKEPAPSSPTESPPIRSLPKKTTDSTTSRRASHANDNAPGANPAAPSQQEKPMEQPAIPAPPLSFNTAEPITTMPEMIAPSTLFGGIQSASDCEILAKQFDAIPASFFTHSQMP
jgi:hypothetical protein